MIITLTDTSAGAISAALLRARRSAGSPSMGMVLTLIVVSDESEYADALQSAMEAGREHPARILLVVTSSGRTPSLDAEVRLGEGTPGEVVVIRMNGAVGAHPASVVRPLLLPDSPVVVWWPGRAPKKIATDELAGLAVRRITDAAAAARPRAALLDRADDYTPGDTDLAWTRITRWRGLLAAALDQYPTRIKAAEVEADRNNPSAELLAAWLETHLQVPVRIKVSAGPGITAARMTTLAGDIAITRPDALLASYAVPGQPERLVALKRREITDLISEELRRMDADQVYESAVKAMLRSSDRPSKKVTGAAISERPPAKKAATAKKAAPAKKTAASKKTSAPDKQAPAKKAAAAKTAPAKKATAKKAPAKRSEG